jgi:hypothetical protein
LVPALAVQLKYTRHVSVVGDVAWVQSTHQHLQLVGGTVGTEHDTHDIGTKDWVCSLANQALQTILCQDKAAMGESLFSKVLGRYVGQSLASEAEVWQVLRRNIVDSSFRISSLMSAEL